MGHRGTETQRRLCVSVSLWLILFSTLFGQQQATLEQLLNQAQRQIDSNQLSQAVETLKQVLILQEDHKLARLAMVDVLMRLTRWEDVDGHVHFLRLHFPVDNQVTYVAAAVAFRKGDFQRAADLAAESISRGDERSAIYKLLAMSRFMLSDAEGFRTNILKAIERNPADGDANYHLGRYFYENKSYLEALAAFDKARTIDLENYRAHYFAALCLQVNGEFEKSEAAYRKAIEIIEKKKVRYGWPFADYGEMLINQGKVDNGLGWLYRATRNDPALPYVHLKYANGLLKKENSIEIEQALKEAIRLDPSYGEAYYLLGRYYNKVGEKDQAQQAFAKFEELRKNPQSSPFGLRR